MESRNSNVTHAAHERSDGEDSKNDHQAHHQAHHHGHHHGHHKGHHKGQHKAHQDPDSPAANRKPIAAKVAEPGVEDAHLGHEHDRESGKTVTKSSRSDGDAAAKDDGEGFPWVVAVGGAIAIAGAIAGLLFLKKRNPDADERLRRTAGDADQRIKGTFGSGERRVKEFIGSGQQKLKKLVGRGGDDHSDIEDDGHDRSRNPLNVFDNGNFYQVKPGDSMEKIARKTGKKSWHDIAEENPSIRNPDLIHPGDRLRV